MHKALKLFLVDWGVKKDVGIGVSKEEMRDRVEFNLFCLLLLLCSVGALAAFF